MRFIDSFAILTLLLAGALGACGKDSNPSSSPMTCGSGTHAVGDECVGDPAGGGDASGPEAGAVESTSDAGDAGSAAVVVHEGDPCPNGRDSVCSGNRIFVCQLVASDVHPVGTLWEDGSCDPMNGTCTINAAHTPVCTGGGYTPCTKQLNDAGNLIDTSYCYSATVRASCNGVTWVADDCGRMGYVCKQLPAGIACAPP